MQDQNSSDTTLEDQHNNCNKNHGNNVSTTVTPATALHYTPFSKAPINETTINRKYQSTVTDRNRGG